MIYKNSYFNKEMRQAYIENRISHKRKLAFGAFLGLITFALHFVLQTLVQSVLSDTVPYIMQTTYFSTVYTYISVSFFMYILYFIIYYEYLSFAEIRKNRWYLLVKMSYNAKNMIFTKIIALFFSFTFIYTIGFAVTVIMTVFLKYPFTYGYLMTLYVAGIIDIAVINIVGATISLFTNQTSNGRYFLLFSAIVLYLLKIITGYHSIITSPNLILTERFSMPFSPSVSPYFTIAVGLILLCCVFCFFRAKDTAKYYSLPFENYDLDLPAGKRLARIDDNNGKFYMLGNKDLARIRSRIFDGVVTAFLIVLVCAAVAFNIFIILISTSQPGKEVTIRGVIPYVFKSETMKPLIEINDLAYFTRVDEQEKISVDSVVLFKEKNEVYIQRVIEIKDDKYIVDIDYYPQAATRGSMIKELERTQIYGVYSHRNRWLGALILFANTIAGRIVFLFVPVIVLFFYKPLRRFFQKTSKLPEAD